MSETIANSIAVIIPEATINLVTNPSAEVNVTGYAAAAGSAIARDTTQRRYGVASIKCTPTANTADGVYWPLTLVAATQYTFSLEFLGAAGVPYRIYGYDQTAAAILGTPITFTGDGEWHRYEVTFTTGANTSHRLFAVKNNDASVEPFYTDAWQVETKDHATTYCDGDQDGCVWTGGRHNSTSTRSAQARSGGRVFDLTDYNIAITEIGGVGMHPRTHNVQQRAARPGATLQSIKDQPRTIQLTGVTDTNAESDMYAALASLEAAFSHHKYAPLQPARIRYTRVDRTIELDVYYDAGLDGRFIEHTYNRFVMRLIAYDDPCWREVGNDAAAIDVNDVLTYSGILARVNGRWSALGPQSGGTITLVSDFAIARDGTIYIAGNFTNWNGIANADHIVAYNPATGVYSALGTGANAAIEGLAIGPDDRLYAVGSFTSIGGTAANRIAVWDGAAWAALGTGLSAIGRDAAFAPDGKLYVAGDFATANGVTVNGITYWNGTTFVALGATPGVQIGTAVYEVEVNQATGLVWIGGTFTTAGGAAAELLATWNGSAWAAPSSNTVGASVQGLMIASDGYVYATGDFTTIGDIAGINGAARYNGTSWEPFGENLIPGGSGMFNVAEGPDGTIWATGLGLDLLTPVNAGVVRFNGYTHILVDALPAWSGSSAMFSVTIDQLNGNVYLGPSSPATVVTAQISGVSTIANEGTAPAYPRFEIKRSGGTTANLVYLKNITTGDELFFDIDILDGETIIIDLSRNDKKIESDFRGVGFASYLPGSKTSNFRLLPGVNEIAALVLQTGSPTMTANILWQNRFDSIVGAMT